MKLSEKHVLQSPESTPTTTSGGSGSSPPAKAPNDTAPEGAPDVSGRVSNEDVVDNEVDWGKEGDPDEPVDTPTGDDTPTGAEDDDTPAPSKPAAKPKAPAKPKPDAGGKPEAGKTGEEDEPSDDDAPQPPAKVEEPKPETPEQKTERERLAKEAEEKSFNDLKEYYKLPEEYVERLRTEPELVLPEIAAKLHTAVITNTQNYMAQMMPQYLAHHARLQEANVKAKEAFFTRWPSLKGHEDQVLKLGAMFSQVNPKATPQQRLEQVGKMTCVALGIDPDPEPEGGEASPRPKAKTAVVKKKPAVKPANPHGGSGAASPPEQNVWTEIAEEFEAEDRGE